MQQCWPCIAGGVCGGSDAILTAAGLELPDSPYSWLAVHRDGPFSHPASSQPAGHGQRGSGSGAQAACAAGQRAKQKRPYAPAPAEALDVLEDEGLHAVPAGPSVPAQARPPPCCQGPVQLHRLRSCAERACPTLSAGSGRLRTPACGRLLNACSGSAGHPACPHQTAGTNTQPRHLAKTGLLQASVRQRRGGLSERALEQQPLQVHPVLSVPAPCTPCTPDSRRLLLFMLPAVLL